MKIRHEKMRRVLRMAEGSSVSAKDIRPLFGSPRRASQYLHKLYVKGMVERVGGDGTKEDPYRYRTLLPTDSAPFDPTGLKWLTAGRPAELQAHE